MKKFKKFYELMLISTSTLFSCTASSEVMFTSTDDPSTAKKPFEATASAGFSAQTGHSKSSALSLATNMTWFKESMAYSLWGNTANNSSEGKRALETYLMGARARYNLTPYHYVFSQASWLSDRFNGYKGRSIIPWAMVIKFSVALFIFCVQKSVLRFVMINILQEGITLIGWHMQL